MTQPAAQKNVSTDKPTRQQAHERFTLDYYARHAPALLDRRRPRSLLRSAYSDAAHMCDAVAEDIEREHTVRGRVTNQGRALAAAVKRAGDAIWQMREKLP